MILMLSAPYRSDNPIEAFEPRRLAEVNGFQSVARCTSVRATGRAPGGMTPSASRRCHLSRTSGHPAGRLPVISQMGAIQQQSSLNFLFDIRRNFAGFGRLFCQFSRIPVSPVFCCAGRLEPWIGFAGRNEGADKGLCEDGPGSGVQQSATKLVRHTSRAGGRPASKSRDHSHCPKPYRLHVAVAGEE